MRLIRLTNARGGMIAGNILRGGPIEFFDGPWQLLNNDFRGTPPGTHLARHLRRPRHVRRADPGQPGQAGPACRQDLAVPRADPPRLGRSSRGEHHRGHRFPGGRHHPLVQRARDHPDRSLSPDLRGANCRALGRRPPDADSSPPGAGGGHRRRRLAPDRPGGRPVPADRPDHRSRDLPGGSPHSQGHRGGLDLPAVSSARASRRTGSTSGAARSPPAWCWSATTSAPE